MTKYYVRIHQCREWWYEDTEFKVRHRIFGPSITMISVVIWYSMGVPHREDGPAIFYSDGRVGYYLNGIDYGKEEYEKILHTNTRYR